MKKNTILFGIIAGLVSIAWGVFSATYGYKTQQFECGGMLGYIMGYTTMIVAFSVIFVAIKRQRDKNNGIITFGVAFRTGLLIAFIASVVYVVVWMIDYYFFIPDYMEKYSAHAIHLLQGDNLPAAQLKTKIDSINQMKAMYSSPFWMIVFTLLEIFPVGLVVAVIAALVLKRRGDKRQVATAN